MIYYGEITDKKIKYEKAINQLRQGLFSEKGINWDNIDKFKQLTAEILNNGYKLLLNDTTNKLELKACN